MKLKSEADDFQVEELTSHPIGNGRYSFYRLSKTHLGTLEAIQAIADHWHLDPRDIACGGLKDKHAKTIQYLTIQNGPTCNLEQKSFLLEFLGHSHRAYTSQDIQGNKFEIRLRSIPQAIKPRLERVLLDPYLGVLNYFDDQRFGSFGLSRQFCAEPWCRGDYERALWLALADFSLHDRPREREQKELLQKRWGDWKWLSQHLDRSHRREAADILQRNPRDFRVALTVIRHDLRSLYLAAFQSHLWNELLGQWLKQLAGDDVFVTEGAAGNLIFPKSANPQLLQLLSYTKIPLPSARITDWPAPFDTLIHEVTSRYGLTPKQIRIKYPRDTFFSKGERSALTKLLDLEHHWEATSHLPTNPPDLESTSHRPVEDLVLKFTLPRGAYATMLVRWLQASARLEPANETPPGTTSV